jgi:integrase
VRERSGRKSWEATGVVEHNHAISHSTDGETVRHQEAYRLAHLPSHLLDLAEKANGADVKVVQDLLRHATTRMTLDTYTQALGADKRAAQSQIVRMIRPENCVFSAYRQNETFSA